MLRNIAILALGAIFLVGPRASAQEWINQVPKKAEQDLTFQDFKEAFDNYYREHPVDLKKDRLSMEQESEGTHDARQRIQIETFNLFKSWEWYTVPRTYPTG